MTAVTRSCAMLLLVAGAACTRTTTHTEIAPGRDGPAPLPRVELGRRSAHRAPARHGHRGRARRDRSRARIRATDSTLVAFGTRNTLSDTLSSTRGVGAARRWLHAQLEAASRDCGGCLRVEYDAAIVAVPRHPDSAARESRERARHPAGPRHVARRRRRWALRQLHLQRVAHRRLGHHQRRARRGRRRLGHLGRGRARARRVAALSARSRRHRRVRALRRRGAGPARLHPPRRATHARGEDGRRRIHERHRRQRRRRGRQHGLDERARLRGGSRQRRDARARALRLGRRRAQSPRLRGAPHLAPRPDRSRRRPLAVRPRGLARTSLHGAARELQAPASPDRRLRARELRLCGPGGAAQRGDGRLARRPLPRRRTPCSRAATRPRRAARRGRSPGAT